MRNIYKYFILGLGLLSTSALVSCDDKLDEAPENQVAQANTDYSKSENMIQPILGLYSATYGIGWEVMPCLNVRGDDVNHGGEGDQQSFADIDDYIYDNNFWMINSAWEAQYRNIITAYVTKDQLELYKANGADAATADKYLAEADVIKCWYLLSIVRNFNKVLIPDASDPSLMLSKELVSQEEAYQYIVDEMERVKGALPAVHPSERADIPGGVTRYTALAVEMLANLELKQWNKVASNAGEIIASNKFELMADFYQLFKIPGKLAKENIFELQYSDFGTGSGDSKSHLFAFYGPQAWTPKVEGAGSGWGFWEPSDKYIKFMLDRGERSRLQTTVLFTDRGINDLKTDSKYATLPSWISNETPSGDVIKDYPRAKFASGKHYLPTDQLTAGRTDYGSNKNFIMIRYAEVLLAYAEAVANGGAPQNGLTAVQAVNEVRARAGLSNLSSVTLDDVLDEKYAEFACEQGQRFWDMLRYDKFNELSYDGRTFTADKKFLPYPLKQIDSLPVLAKEIAAQNSNQD